MAAIRVLVVDDEEAVVDVLRTLIGTDPSLELVGAAHDADAGVNLALLEKPDVVLMDVRMPGGGGERAVREIRDRFPSASVIALSAHEDEDTRIRMIGAGARDYVPKSESTDAILAAIHRSAPKGRRSRRRTGRSGPEASEQRKTEQRSRVERALRSGSVATTFQPIVDLETAHVIGVEAQPQVAMLPQRPFDAWRGDAQAVDLLVKLEVAALRSALAALPSLSDDVFVELEVTPRTAEDSRFHRAIRDVWAPRLVLAVSELSHPGTGFAASIAPLRERGVRLTLADVGADIAGLGQLVSLWPEYVRLDRALTDGIDADATRHAVVAAAVGWSSKAGAAAIADGVNSVAQMEELIRLGVRLAQGGKLGRTRHLADLAAHGLDPVSPALRRIDEASDDGRLLPVTEPVAGERRST